MILIYNVLLSIMSRILTPNPYLQNDFHQDIRMPRVLENSYNFKIKKLTEDDILFDYAKDWPSLISIKANNSVPIHNCPSRMHQILWGQNASLPVRLFLKSQSALLGPEFGTHELLHHPKYTVQAFPGSYPSGFPRFTEVNLKESQYIFIPETYLVGLGVENEGPVNVFRMCFVDASNLKVFREEISLESRVSPYAKRVLNQLGDISFDFSMNREPGLFTLRTLQPGVDTETVAGDNLSEIPSDAQRSRSRRRKSGGKFKGIH